jgi:hypothetical protein
LVAGLPHSNDPRGLSVVAAWAVCGVAELLTAVIVMAWLAIVNRAVYRFVVLEAPALIPTVFSTVTLILPEVIRLCQIVVLRLIARIIYWLNSGIAICLDRHNQDVQARNHNQP